MSTPATLSAVRPGPAASTAAPWTWMSRTRMDRSPGTSRSVVPRAREPPRSVPVTTAPRPFTENTRSIARRTGPPPFSRAAVTRRTRRSNASISARRRSNPSRSPPTADTARIGDRTSDVPARSSVTSLTTSARRSASTRSAFVMTAIPDLISSASRSSPDARASAPAARRPRRRRASRRRSRRRPPACCRQAGRGPGRRRSPATARRPKQGGRTRRRSSCRVVAPRAGGRRRCRSARAAASSCRGRCGLPSRRRRSSGVRRRRERRRERSRARESRVVGRINRSEIENHARRARPDRRPAGSPARSRVASAAAPRPATTRPTDWSVSPGNDPPPTADVDPIRGPPSDLCRKPLEQRVGAATQASVVAAIIRQTGISVVASPARYRPRVAASAASVTLSGRTARASGSRRIRAMRSARPTISPACGPPTSLSPLNVTRSARPPAARRESARGRARRPPCRATPRCRRHR